MIMYCVRHGESVFNADHRIQGQSDTPLSPRGRQQAEALAARFRKLTPIDAIYSGPLARARETANIIAQAIELTVQIEDRLKEINAGIFQGLRWEEIDHVHPEEARRWREQDPDFVIPNGESRRQLMQRGQAALEAIHAAGHERVIVVSHGGLLTAAFKALLCVPAEINPFSLYNASINQLVWDRRIRLMTLNEIEHLAGVEPKYTGDM
jgi:probable phosphoglycerate mutase